MFHSLIENLCDNEILMDVGQQGIASQSSYSVWSKPNDSHRPLTKEYFDDFAFHTDKQLNPWWQVAFREPKKIKHIIINNRRKKPYDKRNQPLVVSVIKVEGNKEQIITIYDGNSLFGCLSENTIPLILTLDDMYIKSIRISLKDTNYLALHQICILAKTTLQQKENKLIFFSSREDGLGERLRAIINTIVMAKLLNGDYYFTWPEIWDKNLTPYASIDNPEYIFSKNFMDRHLKAKDFVNKLTLTKPGEIKQITLEKLKNFDGLIYQQSPLNLQNYAWEFKNQNYDLSSAFNEIEFSEAVIEIKRYADSISLPTNIVAIHLRTGDLVYAVFRLYHNYHTKVLPLFLVPEMIKYFKECGYQVILFSLETKVCEYLSKEYDVLTASQYYQDNFNSTQLAFFDIFLMSRCTEIYSGDGSGFALLAGLISNIQVNNYSTVFNEQEIIHIFKDEISESGLLSKDVCSPLLIAFNIVFFIRKYHHLLDMVTKRDLMKKCVEYDKENILNMLIYLIFEAQCGDKINANRLLMAMIEKTNTYHEIEKIIRHFVYHNYALDIFMTDIKNVAKEGLPAFAILLLIYQYYRLRNIDKELFSAILNIATEEEYHGVNLLIDKLNEFK